MKVALYARYSSDNQRDASIEDQLRIAIFCQRPARPGVVASEAKTVMSDKFLGLPRRASPRQIVGACEEHRSVGSDPAADLPAVVELPEVSPPIVWFAPRTISRALSGRQRDPVRSRARSFFTRDGVAREETLDRTIAKD